MGEEAVMRAMILIGHGSRATGADDHGPLRAHAVPLVLTRRDRAAALFESTT